MGHHGLSSGYFYGLFLRKTRNADVALKSSPIKCDISLEQPVFEVSFSAIVTDP